MRITGGLDPHAMRIPPAPYENGNLPGDGRALVSPATVPGEATKTILSIASQSLLGNFAGGAYVKVSSRIDNFCHLNGGTYAAAEPLLGTDGLLSNSLIHMADLLIAAGWSQRIILAPAAVGGSPIQMWAPAGGGDPEGVFAYRIPQVAARLRQAALAPAVIQIEIGTTDGSAGTSQAVFTARMQRVLAVIRAQPGWEVVPVLLAKSTWLSGATSVPVRAAVDALVNPAAHIHAGPDTDAITARRDSAHLDATGRAAHALAWKNVVAAF